MRNIDAVLSRKASFVQKILRGKVNLFFITTGQVFHINQVPIPTQSCQLESVQTTQFENLQCSLWIQIWSTRRYLELSG